MIEEEMKTEHLSIKVDWTTWHIAVSSLA